MSKVHRPLPTSWDQYPIFIIGEWHSIPPNLHKQPRYTNGAELVPQFRGYNSTPTPKILGTNPVLFTQRNCFCMTL